MAYRIIRENENYVFEIIIPCEDENDLKVSVDKLNISVTRAENKNDGDEVYSSYGFNVNDKEHLEIQIKEYELKWRKAKSEYKNGILTITIPRVNPAIALLSKLKD